MILGQQVVSNGGGQSSLELVSNGDINIVLRFPTPQENIKLAT